MSQFTNYPWGRGIANFSISGFLGVTLGMAAQGVIGVLSWAFKIGFVGWLVLCGITLAVSLHVVQRIATRTSSALDEAEAHHNQIDSWISMAGFGLAYLLAWILLASMFLFVILRFVT